MPSSLLMAVEYGGYISIIKLAILLVAWFLWLMLIHWSYKDAKAVDTNISLWMGVLLGAGVLGTLLWWLIPIFIAGVLIFTVCVCGTAIAYIRHRNTHVLDFDRLLTIEHIKHLVAGSHKIEAMEGFMFITANNNEVPPPEPRTPMFFGYRTAYDVLTDALWRRTGTITFTPKGENYDVTYSIDGMLTKQSPLSREQTDYLIYFAKELAGLDSKEKRKPQRGKFRTRQNKENVDWEVMTAGSTAGEQLRLTHVSKEHDFRISELGLSPDQQEQLSQFRELRPGIFLITGPRRSGVTTTMYALLRNHDAFINNINTLEKQPSTEINNVTQHTFKLTDTGTTTYAKKLQSIVRMGPNVVGVGECEDSETAKVACAAAMDGQVVYVVMAADSVLQALGKWIKMVGDRRMIAQTLLGVSNQRLLRMLCDECKQGYAPNTELLKKFNLPAEKAKVMYRPGKEVYDKRGKASTCNHCQGTGFIGRTAVFEMVIFTDELRKAIKQIRQLPELGMVFRRAKMLYLQEQALRKVISGTTAINEMVRVLSPGKKQSKAAP